MFHLSTLKSKTFWVGVAGIIAGGYLVYKGETEKGLQAIGAGALAITGSDRLTKILEEVRR